MAHTMNEDEFKRFMQDQAKAIEHDAKLYKEKTGKDADQKFILKWINENSEIFRQKWTARKKEGKDGSNSC